MNGCAGFCLLCCGCGCLCLRPHKPSSSAVAPKGRPCIRPPLVPAGPLRNPGLAHIANLPVMSFGSVTAWINVGSNARMRELFAGLASMPSRPVFRPGLQPMPPRALQHVLNTAAFKLISSLIATLTCCAVLRPIFIVTARLGLRHSILISRAGAGLLPVTSHNAYYVRYDTASTCSCFAYTPSPFVDRRSGIRCPRPWCCSGKTSVWPITPR